MMKKNRRILSLLLAVSLLFSSSVLVSAEPAQTEEAEVVRLGEVESLRETNSQTYLLSDGSYECVVYAEDKFYLDESDTLQLIDNSIKAETTALSTTYKNTANVFDVTFSDDSTPEVSIALDGKSVTFSPLNASGGTGNHIVAEDCVALVGKVNNCQTLDTLTSTGSNTVTYEDAFTNTDLVYVLENHALKEYIILNSASAPNEFSFLFSMEGLTMQTVDGKTYFADENGESVFGLADLFAIDAENAMTEDVTYSFVPVKGTANVIVTVTLDEDYLTAPERVFPVVIDPSLMISSIETADACVCSYYPNTNFYMSDYLRTGMSSDYGIRRSYIQFDIPTTIPEGSVTSASLDIEKEYGSTPNIRAYRCILPWTSSTITWDNQVLYNTTHELSYSPLATQRSSGSAWYTMDVTSIVQSWVDGLRTNYGFALADATETDSNHWTTYYSSDADSPHKPELHITYTETTTAPETPPVVDEAVILEDVPTNLRSREEHLCIPCAITNVAAYWCVNGYSQFNCSTAASQESTAVSVHNTMINLGGSAMANANISYGFSLFQHRAGSITYGFSSANYWSTNNGFDENDIIDEIDAGRPVMLGFSSYSPAYGTGHMTVCVGYDTSGDSTEVYVSDAHVGYYVKHILSIGDENDFICKVQIVQH